VIFTMDNSTEVEESWNDSADEGEEIRKTYCNHGLLSYPKDFRWNEFKDFVVVVWV
jgi:hypothetical protein